jgi:hypothetical protein
MSGNDLKGYPMQGVYTIYGLERQTMNEKRGMAKEEYEYTILKQVKDKTKPIEVLTAWTKQDIQNLLNILDEHIWTIWATDKDFEWTNKIIALLEKEVQ